jgi:hypothetical protein
VITGEANALTTGTKGLYFIKEALIGFSNAPYTVVGSCDSVNYAMDGTDYWTDYTKLVFAIGTNDHSWIVLKQTGIGANFQIVIECKTTNTSYPRITFAFSPSAGFTGGDETARPTATDEVVVINTLEWFWITSGTNGNGVINVMQSTDGECTRIVCCGNNAACTLFIIDKPKNPDSSWTNPCVVAHKRLAVGSEALTYAFFNDLDSNVHGLFTGVETTYFLATIGAVAAMLGEQIGGVNDVENAYEIYPIWLFSSTPTRKGTHGQLYDLWFSTTVGLVTGDTYPLAGSLTFAQFGQMVFPWDGATVPIVTGS